MLIPFHAAESPQSFTLLVISNVTLFEAYAAIMMLRLPYAMSRRGLMRVLSLFYAPRLRNRCDVLSCL